MQLTSEERTMLGPAIFCEDELQKILARPTVVVERPNEKSISLIEPLGDSYCVAHAYVGCDVTSYAKSLIERYRYVTFCSLRPGLARLLYQHRVGVRQVADRQWVFQ